MPKQGKNSEETKSNTPVGVSTDIDDDVVDILGTKQGKGGTSGNANASGNNQNSNQNNNQEVTQSRARRRREEAVRRLVNDVHFRPTANNSSFRGQGQQQVEESHDWLVASTVATALERGLDKDLHSELVQESKENAARIGQVCHDHSDAFLASVGRVVALGDPASGLEKALQHANTCLQTETAGSMLESAALLEHSKQANQRSRTLAGMVTACRNVAVLLERARKQAERPRAALDAVDEARTCLSAPVSSLILGMSNATATQQQHQQHRSGAEEGLSLEETPFGHRALIMLPKIENEVLMGARRGLNRWFLALRSGGDGAKAGRSVLRKCAHSMAIGPGQLGLGGHLPPSYIWRAKVADNLLSRMDQTLKVARSVRIGYFFERDAPKEGERLEKASMDGMERRAEAFASAFGYYRCWDSNAPLMVDISDLNLETTGASSLLGSRHGGSRHGRGPGGGGGGKSLSFRGSQRGAGGGNKDNPVSVGITAEGKERARATWAAVLTPHILFDDSPTRYVATFTWLLLCSFVALFKFRSN